MQLLPNRPEPHDLLSTMEHGKRQNIQTHKRQSSKTPFTQREGTGTHKGEQNGPHNQLLALASQPTPFSMDKQGFSCKMVPSGWQPVAAALSLFYLFFLLFLFSLLDHEHFMLIQNYSLTSFWSTMVFSAHMPEEIWKQYRRGRRAGVKVRERIERDLFFHRSLWGT